MLDSVTKQGIDRLRDILVGKIPSPERQVAHITTGLMYKFMDDMDTESVEMGGMRSFFAGDYEKHAWHHLFNPQLGGAEKVRLYREAIEAMPRHAPPLFRDIFKDASLDLQDPPTLMLFVKEIDQFRYSHSETLGDAYEYLLSFMGSQGDAGQFRTPRHIIEFMVTLINPQKDETILDPACGTAGFLISSFKHIEAQNSDKRPGDKLDAADKRRIIDNLVGYDISPPMVRLSLVNMYLHRFANPRIYEYDSLSSEERWGEYYDIILANPPFFSPKGGIRPHSRFGVASKRAEVLFVDYIRAHLTARGRAGIIVPEGIIFQTGRAYQALRKRLVEDCLMGVISLPAGVFQPYSGVKTSLLVLDKELHRRSESLFFARVEHDGFSLGAQRTAIAKNDLPGVIEQFRRFCSDPADFVGASSLSIARQAISERGDYSLSFPSMQADIKSAFPLVKLGEVFKNITDTVSPENIDSDSIKYVGLEHIERQTGLFVSDFDGSTDGIKSNKNKFKKGDILYGKLRPNLNKVVVPPFEGLCSTDILVLRGDNTTLSEFYHAIFLSNNFNREVIRGVSGAQLPRTKFSFIKEIRIPLPPIDVQREIVAIIEEAFQEIDAAIANSQASLALTRDLLPSYLSHSFDPSWPLVKLGEVVDLLNGYAFKSSDLVEQGIQLVRMGNVKQGFFDKHNKSVFLPASFKEKYSKFLISEGDLIISMTGTTDKEDYGNVCKVSDSDYYFLNQRVGRFLKESERIDLDYFYYITQSSLFRRQLFANSSGGVRQANISGDSIKQIKIPLPPIDVQREIVHKLERVSEASSGLEQLSRRKLAAYNALKSSLLAQAFCGKLTAAPPPDPRV